MFLVRFLKSDAARSHLGTYARGENLERLNFMVTSPSFSVIIPNFLKDSVWAIGPDNGVQCQTGHKDAFK